MYIPLGIRTDYTLLTSLIKIPDLIDLALNNKLPALGILDENLSGSLEFYNSCVKNNIKPIIGLKIKLNNNILYLYAKSYLGYKSLLKINTKISNNTLNLDTLKKYNQDVICVIPYYNFNKELYNSKIFNEVYISYKNILEKKRALLITSKIVYINEVLALSKEDLPYLKVLYKINSKKLEDVETFYLQNNLGVSDINLLSVFVSKIDIKIPKNRRYIPIYCDDSKELIYRLCNKGLYRRLNGNIPLTYQQRLNYELKVIEEMGFIDYFLIVYDYVLYAKKNNCLVGPGRGSAAGSLVSYCLGITEIDPVKYNLLFERFLNPSRVTMPDIDIDFEDVRRNDIVLYVRNRYGTDKVAPIMTYGTLAARQVLRDIAKALNVNSTLIDRLVKQIDSKLTLKENLNNKTIKDLVEGNLNLKKVVDIGLHLENLKRHTSTHAAGVVIASVQLDDIIPVIYNGDVINTGVTMNYLEDLGLLKMDFLSLSNLTIIHKILDLIPVKINLNKIDLNDKAVYELFQKNNTNGIFQFESGGMKNLLRKLQPTCFNDLVASVALFRPGPMDNIDTFIARKHKKEKITYITPSLQPILKETYGIIVYQEQIMQILSVMAKFSFSEADNIRRAMSKKKADIILQEKERFINSSINNGYSSEVATEVYELIEKFANYGFNKAHSVSYALIGYQMAYLKVHYKKEFIAGILNLNINSDAKTKEYLDEARKLGVVLLKPDINMSSDIYLLKKNALVLPLSIIKNVGAESVKIILKEREGNSYKDFYDFVKRTYHLGINKKILTSLINASVFDSFNLNHNTLVNMLDNTIRYAEVAIDSDLGIEKPLPEILEEYSETKLMKDEIDSYGFYISNHPASRYKQKGLVKIIDVPKCFNKRIKIVVLINKIKKIKTKNNDDMAFITGSDETGLIEFVLFPKYFNQLEDILGDTLVLISGVVARTRDKYQVNIEKIGKV